MVAAQGLSLLPTLLTSALLAIAAVLGAGPLFPRLLKRSRWLFLTMGLLFLWMSPGLRLPEPWGDWGLTWEGLQFAAEHLARLLSILALVALLLTKLDPEQIVSGLYFLIPQYSSISGFARALAVRLALTLAYVAGKSDNDWKTLLQLRPGEAQTEMSSVHLMSQPWTWRDNVLTLAGAGLALVTLVGGFA